MKGIKSVEINSELFQIFSWHLI